MEKKIQRSRGLLDPLSCPAARGTRVRSLRKMVGLSRGALEEKYGINSNTLQSWEKAKAGGLSEKGALRFINAMEYEGVSCSLDWLMFGVGLPAQLESANLSMVFCVEEKDKKKYIPNDAQQTIMVKELLTFRSLNENTLDFQVQDDGMAPLFMPGDLVAGKKRVGEDILSLVHLNCIVQTEENEFFLRCLLSSTNTGYYNLTCINPFTTVYKYTIYEKKLLSAAPIAWHRRRDPERQPE